MTALYVAGLVTNGDHVALIQSTKLGRAWELPGGKAHPREEWRAALSREVHEEMGLDVPPHRWVLVDVLHGEPTPGADFESTIIVARAEASGDLVPGSDAQDARWYPRGALPEDISKLASRHVLFDWQAERPLAHVTREEIEDIQRRAILEQQAFHCVSADLATANRLALEVLAQRGAHGILRDMVARAERAAEKLAADLAAFKRATVDAFTEADLTEARAEGRREAYEAIKAFAADMAGAMRIGQKESDPSVAIIYEQREKAYDIVVMKCENRLRVEQTGSHRG